MSVLGMPEAQPTAIFLLYNIAYIKKEQKI